MTALFPTCTPPHGLHRSELRASNVPKELLEQVLKELAKHVSKSASQKVKSILWLPSVQNVKFERLLNGKEAIIKGHTLVIDRNYAKKVVTSTLNNLAKNLNLNNLSTETRKRSPRNVFYIGLPINSYKKGYKGTKKQSRACVTN